MDSSSQPASGEHILEQKQGTLQDNDRQILVYSRYLRVYASYGFGLPKKFANYRDVRQKHTNACLLEPTPVQTQWGAFEGMRSVV